MKTEKEPAETKNIYCEHCHETVTITLAGSFPRCPICHDGICIHCGCTDTAGCPDGCWWAGPGVCSSCEFPDNKRCARCMAKTIKPDDPHDTCVHCRRSSGGREVVAEGTE